MSDQREEFERAYAVTVVDASDGKGWGTCTVEEMVRLMVTCRTSDDAYVFAFETLAPIDNLLTTGMENAAWWSWRAGQAMMLLKMKGGGDHVLH